MQLNQATLPHPIKLSGCIRGNGPLTENWHSQKHNPGNAQGFLIDGMGKVWDVIEKSRKPKRIYSIDLRDC